MRSSLPLVFGVLFTLACGGPLGPVPGGEISGAAAPPPGDWSKHAGAAEETIQLETRPSDPYSVNLWGLALESGYYVAAGRGEKSTWVGHIRENPEVRLGIAEEVYELRAVRVTDEAELEVFSKALEAKYEFEATPEQKDSAWIFRLDAR